jgi:DNA polymerase III epsilon subunit family exonuclease
MAAVGANRPFTGMSASKDERKLDFGTFRSVDDRTRTCRHAASISVVWLRLGGQAYFGRFGNPQRPIPAKIVELTSITNEMVRDAPAFHEISASFMAFMGDGLFVAHNVNFDYGFLSYEYARLERRFRFPKLCTCVGMRRRYPGHKSYGLGKLYAIYDIALDDHHRALCDARAAARLLNLINKKRDDGVSAGAEHA